MATITSTQLIQEFMENFHYSRRLLVAPATIISQYHPAEATTMAPLPARIDDLPIGNNVNTFDANVIMVLAVLLSALICSLVLNSIIKCVFKCYSSLILTSDSSAGDNNKGITKKALKTFPIITYTTELKHPGLGSECVICLTEFGIGEKVKVLPKCNHGFHAKCIDKWLNSHSSCPTCRNCLIQTCQKIVNGRDNSVTISSATVLQETIIRIEPLQREGVNYIV